LPSVTAKLEFSVDPLSDTTPAWTDITRYVQAMTWYGGVQKDTDAPEAGGATFVLKNLQRRFEPEYTAGAYYPNIVPGRRFRVTITADGVNYTQGIYYAREWKVEYPDVSLGYSVVTVSCTDGFWRLSQDQVGYMSPVEFETYEDLVKSDNPFAFYLLNDANTNQMTASVGPNGRYIGQMDDVLPNPVTGSHDRAAQPADSPSPQPAYGRAPIQNIDTWSDIGVVSLECVATTNNGIQILAAGPWVSASSAYQFSVNNGSGVVRINTGAGDSNLRVDMGVRPTGTHHHCMTFDGNTLAYYLDGVLQGTSTTSGIIQPSVDGLIYVHDGHTTVENNMPILSSVAFYTSVLPPDRIAAHADAAINRGYAAATTGTRVAALATDPLWSTAGIPAGYVTVAATFQHGQPVIDEINTAVQAEAPGSLFYFNDAGNPAYESLLDTWAPAATFGDSGTEVRYSQLDLAYDDDLVNSVTVGGENIKGTTHTNTQSLSDYGNRGLDLSDLSLMLQSDAELLAQTYIDRFSTPAYRCESITLNGQDANQRLQILTRELGDVIRVRRRGEGGVPIDLVTRILRKEKSVDVHGNLLCTWSLARGFNATLAQWHINTTGFGELGQTTTLA